MRNKLDAIIEYSLLYASFINHFIALNDFSQINCEDDHTTVVESIFEKKKKKKKKTRYNKEDNRRLCGFYISRKYKKLQISDRVHNKKVKSSLN